MAATTITLARPARTRRSSPATWLRPAGLIGPAVIVVAVGALAPFIVLVLYSLGVLGDKEPAGIGVYQTLLTTDFVVDTFVKTLRMAAIVTVVAMFVAVPLAFVISRSRGWARTLLTCLVVLPLLVNIVVRNLGWVLLLSDNGTLNSLLRHVGLSQSLTGTLGGIGLVLVHVSIPLIVLPLLASIDSIEPAQREAAQSLGAHPAISFVRITLPSVATGMIAGAVLSFVIATGSLVTPLFLGKGRVTVVPTLIVQQIQTYRWERAAAMSIILFVVSVAVVVVLQRLARRASAGRTAGARGRGAVLRRRPLTAAATALNGAPTFEAARRWTTRTYVTVVGIFLVAPMLVIIKNGLDTAQVSGPGMEGFTLKWVGQALSSDGYRTQLLFSLKLAVIAVACGLVLSAAASWAIVRFRFPGRDAVVAFLMSPLLMPQAALAVGYVLFFLILHTDPSFQRLLLAHVVVTIPFMTRVLVSTFESVDARMEEAAAALGAPPRTVFRRITLPIVRSGIFTATLFGFLVSFDESAISVLVASGSTTTLPVKLLSDMQFQATPVGAAIAAVLIVAITAIVIPLERRLGIASSAVAVPRRKP